MLTLKDRRAAEKAAKLAEQQRRAQKASRPDPREVAAAAMVRHMMRLQEMADDAERMQPDQVTDLEIPVHIAYERLMNGDATGEHLSRLSAVADIALMLSKIGYGNDGLHDVMRGQDAAVSLIDRYERDGFVTPTECELSLLRAMIDVHDQQLHFGPTRAEMREVLAEIKLRQERGDVLRVTQ